MTRLSIYMAYLLAGLLMLTSTACGEDQTPHQLPPLLSVEQAQDITRNETTLAGHVSPQSDAPITKLCFRYGTTSQMEEHIVCDPNLRTPVVKLDKLTPNTRYYYCLEAGNDYDLVQSQQLQFTTQPNQKPSVGTLTLLGQGPLSAILTYEIMDDGGEDIVETGIYYQPDGRPRQKVTLTPAGEGFRVHLRELEPRTTYQVQAFAANSMGEALGEPLTLHTSEAIRVSSAGMLAEIVGRETMYDYAEVTIAGPLNGTDLRFLRQMLGRNMDGSATGGRVSRLNLADATICQGGVSYDYEHYTTPNTIGQGMFANCPHLNELLLPDNAVSIEENAFSGSNLLTMIEIPAAVTQIVPSANCPALSTIQVSAANTAYAGVDGMLYNKNLTHLYWCPEAQSGSVTLPQSLLYIEKFAFRNSRLTSLDLPEGVKEIAIGVFYDSQLQNIALPAGIEQIRKGMFQNCRQLATVSLGSNVNRLDDYCFDDCPLQHLYVTTADMPPSCSEHTFSTTQYAGCTLHVPVGCKAMYSNSNYWGRFEKIVE